MKKIHIVAPTQTTIVFRDDTDWLQQHNKPDNWGNKTRLYPQRIVI